MDYKLFYLIARQRDLKIISRGLFVLDWAREQKRQGIKPPAWDRNGPKKPGA
ncbi:MAG: hypothetical protein LBJ90_01490 [Treponema sp.]|nr:hypothetical protein [Treponema sp.]